MCGLTHWNESMNDFKNLTEGIRVTGRQTVGFARISIQKLQICLSGAFSGLGCFNWKVEIVDGGKENEEVSTVNHGLKILIKTLQSCADPFKDEKKIFLIYQIKESAIQMIDHYIKWITQLENTEPDFIYKDKVPCWRSQNTTFRDLFLLKRFSSIWPDVTWFLLQWVNYFSKV